MKYDVIVIGGGPGGYVCSIRLAQLGKKVAIIDKRPTLGGTCLNVGCIPTKALLDSTEIWHNLQNLADHGISVEKPKVNLAELMKRKDKVVGDTCSGVDFLMKKNKITRYTGTASFKNKNEVIIKTDSEEITVSGINIVIATGSVPVQIPGAETDGQTVITSDEAIALTEIPKELVIIGAGVIGLELGSVWNRLGSKVTIIELMDKLFGNADKQVSALALRSLKNQGMEILLGHKFTGITRGGKKPEVTARDPKGNEIRLPADKVLVAVGRKPYTDNLGLDKAGVSLTDRGRIRVTGWQTEKKHIYAIGDVIDGPMLAHKAEEEGIAVAEIIASGHGHVNYTAIPSIVYTWPEVAWVGKGEEELKAEGIPYKTGKAYFKSNGRARAMNESEGMVKILAHKETDKLLGFYIMGPRASDMIAEAVIAFEFGAYAEDIARSVHAHPTLSEVVMEAAMDTDNWSIHS